MEVNILLVIVGGIIAIGAIVGFAKGAVRIAVSLGATILTLAVVYFATPYVSKAIYSLTPVSYTHLDVYKRQSESSVYCTTSYNQTEAALQKGGRISERI